MQDAQRLEALWSGSFGDDYVDRNAEFATREPFWTGLLAAYPPRRVLEVGCNTGGNLQWITPFVPPASVYGIDVNQKALSRLRYEQPGVNALEGQARDLPFRDGYFDLVFTMGVLIHQPEVTLPRVMAEMVRTSRRWVLCGEYHAEVTTAVSYRGEEGALFRRDYGSLFAEMFPELRLVEGGFLDRAHGWDDVTWWLFERS